MNLCQRMNFLVSFCNDWQFLALHASTETYDDEVDDDYDDCKKTEQFRFSRGNGKPRIYLVNRSI